MDLNDLVKNPDQIKGLITILQALLDSQATSSDTSLVTEPKTPKKKTRTTSKQNRKQKETPQRENKFLSMPEKNMHKEDVEIDKRLNKLPPTPRSRSFKPIRVTCRVCGKSENVNPNYMTTEIDRYKCNKCSGAAG